MPREVSAPYCVRCSGKRHEVSLYANGKFDAKKYIAIDVVLVYFKTKVTAYYNNKFGGAGDDYRHERT